MFQVQALNSFEDNYIWLVGKKNTPEVIIVDPGDGEPVLDFVKKQALKPVAIFITHHHYDHTGGTQELSRQYNIPVYGPALEKIPCLTHPLKQDDVVYIKENDLTFKILDVPGHTRGHIAFYVEGALFCGDTLFTAGSGRLFEGTAAQMQQSMDLILALPDETQVYCAHEYTLANLSFAQVAEPQNDDIQKRILETQRLCTMNKPTVPASLALEKKTNPFLRTHLPEIIKGAEKFAGHPLQEKSDVFSVVRQWKDSLD